ncbi:hypothetical protein Hypma_014826 [Hypsizygus marmoreus]|uniref:DUF6534 domain-containing protein n=1 Tax=Hypsizygus marmoreus TaxID=39966 RepID=A0A369KAD4_HYPMA|nr:hypothetical protein Hypma_014826 [Hypsizygus marmoreus]
MASDQSFVDISPLHGGNLIGTFLACAVWGISSFQTFLYYMNCDKDSIVVRCLVGFLWALDTANQVVLTKGNWRILISRYGSPTILVAPMPEYMHHAWIAGLVYSVVQLYFIRRIYILAKSLIYRSFNSLALNVLSAILAILAAWQIVAVAVYEVYGYQQSLEVLGTKREIAWNLSARAAAVTVDIVVAACMVFLLTREVPQYKRSRKVVHRLLILTVSSGSLTALLVTIVLVLVTLYPTTLYWAAVDQPLCSIYFSTLLANLNTREYIGGRYEANTTPDIELGSAIGVPNSKMVASEHFPDRDQTEELQTGPNSVHVYVQRYAEHDDNSLDTPSKIQVSQLKKGPLHGHPVRP